MKLHELMAYHRHRKASLFLQDVLERPETYAPGIRQRAIDEFTEATDSYDKILNTVEVDER